MTKIPRFTAPELEGIAQLLDTEQIPFEFEGVTVGASGFGATTEYFLIVEQENFVDTCALLMDYYNINNGTKEPLEGVCPACESMVSGSIDCPDCGLNFSFETPSSVKEHPFYKFLRDNSLLPPDGDEIETGK